MLATDAIQESSQHLQPVADFRSGSEKIYPYFVDANYHLVEVGDGQFYSRSFWSSSPDHKPHCYHRLTVDLFACILQQFGHIERQWENGDLSDHRYHLILHRFEEIKKLGESLFTREAIKYALSKHQRFPKPEVEWEEVCR